MSNSPLGCLAIDALRGHLPPPLQNTFTALQICLILYVVGTINCTDLLLTIQTIEDEANTPPLLPKPFRSEN